MRDKDYNIDTDGGGEGEKYLFDGTASMSGRPWGVMGVQPVVLWGSWMCLDGNLFLCGVYAS